MDDETTPLLQNVSSSSAVACSLDEVQTKVYSRCDRSVKFVWELIPRCFPNYEKIPFTFILGLPIGCFVNNFASGFLIGTYETLISPSLHFEQVTGLKSNSIILAGAVFDAGCKPLLALLKVSHGGLAVAYHTLPILGSGYFLSGISLWPWMLLGSQALSGLGGATFDLLPMLVLSDSLPKSSLGIWRFWASAVNAIGSTAGGGLSSFVATQDGGTCELSPDLKSPATKVPNPGEQLSWRIPLTVIGFLTLCFYGIFRSRGGLSIAGVTLHRTYEGSLPKKNRSSAAGALILLTVISTLLAINLAGSNDPRSYAKQEWTNPRKSCIITSSVVALVSLCSLVVVECRVDQSTFPWKSFMKPNLLAMTLSLAASVLAYNLMTYRLALYVKIRKLERDANNTDWALASIFWGSFAGLCFAGFVIKRTRRARMLLFAATLVSLTMHYLLSTSSLAPDRELDSLVFSVFGFCLSVIDQCLVIAFISSVEAADKDLLVALFSLIINLVRDCGVSIASIVCDAHIVEELERILPASQEKRMLIRTIMNDLDCMKFVPEDLRMEVLGCLRLGKERAFGFAAVAVAFSFCATFFLPKVIPERDAQELSMVQPGEGDGNRNAE